MEKNIELYIDKLASKAPTPGGGGVAALAASLGAALASMVCNLTIGKPKYAQFEDELKEIVAEAQLLSKKCLELATEDEVAFEPLSRAYSLPSTTDEEKRTKDEVLESALVRAANVPMMSAQAACDAIDIHRRLVEKGSKLVISDVGVGVQMARAALLSAALNVKINTKLMKNRAVADKMNEQIEALVKKGSAAADDVYCAVSKMLE